MERERLTAVPFFAGMPEETVDALARVASSVEVGSGEAIATEGDFGHALFAIESGTAEVSHDGTVLRELGPGDVFGEIAVLKGGRRTATVRATSELRLIALLNRDVWRLEHEAPDAAQHLLDLIAARLA